MKKQRCKAWCFFLISLTLWSLTFAGPLGIRQATAQDDSAKSAKSDRQSDLLKQSTYYKADVVQTVHVEIDEKDLARMKAALPKLIYVPASFRWKDISIRKVGIRYKGNSSSNPNQQHKRSFLIKFSEFKKKQRFLGMRRVSFDNGIQFGSLFSEPIITEILREEGIVTHRCNYAKLYLNDKYYGVYGNVERIDQSFLKYHLPDEKGALFKVHLGGPGANFQFIGDDPSAYSRAFEAKTKAARKNPERLVELIKMVNQVPKDEFAKAMEANMELESFLRITAIMLYSGAFDQLTGWGPHNYYLYHDGIHNRWRYMPWDLDVGFSDNAFGRVKVIEEWNAAWPVAGGGSERPILDRIVDDAELLKRYREIADQILEKHFKPAKLKRRFEAKHQLIKNDLVEDPFPHRRVTNPTDTDYASILETMKAFVDKRYKTARAQLDSPGERPKIVRRSPQQGGEPRPGTASPDAPTNLKVVSVSGSSVVLTWTDNAKGEAGHIVQRSSGDKNEKFQNYKGMPGNDVTRATDSQVKAKETYRYRVYAVRPTPMGLKGSGVSNVVTVTIESDKNEPDKNESDKEE